MSIAITKGMPPIVGTICREFGYDPAQLESLEWEATILNGVERVSFTVLTTNGILTECVWWRNRAPETRYLGLAPGKAAG